MNTDELKLLPLLLDEHDAAAVSALLIRMVRLDSDLARDREVLAELNAKVAAGTVLRGKTVSAFTVFGFETGEGLWERVRGSIGAQAYKRAIAIGKGEDLPLLEKIRESDEARVKASADEETNERATLHVPRIKDAILEYLQNVGDEGAGVREVRRHLADAYNINVHEKTPGMTLYRLLKEGLVTRSGRTWFAAPPQHELEGTNALSDASIAFDELLGKLDTGPKEEKYQE